MIRVKKEDSAFIYAIMESHEGIVSYSTLAHKEGSSTRDLELRVPLDFVDEVDVMLGQLVRRGVLIERIT